MVTDWALSVSLCSMAPPTTTTRSVSAVVPAAARGLGDGLGAGVTATCAVAMLALMTGARNIKNDLFKIRFS
jgi:hypothetical protein